MIKNVSGPPGTGKSYRIRLDAEARGKPFGEYVTTRMSYPSDVIRAIAPTFEHGGVFVLSDLDRADPDLVALIELSITKGRLEVNGRWVTLHADAEFWSTTTAPVNKT